MFVLHYKNEAKCEDFENDEAFERNKSDTNVDASSINYFVLLVNESIDTPEFEKSQF